VSELLGKRVPEGWASDGEGPVPPGPVLGEVRGRGDIQWCVLGVFSIAHRSQEHRLHSDTPVTFWCGNL